MTLTLALTLLEPRPDSAPTLTSRPTLLHPASQVTYPINAVSSVFWIAIPPWICIGGEFPFRFNPTFAILGSLVLRLIEWAIVLQVPT